MTRGSLLGSGIVLLLLATVAAFIPCLSGDFVYDDFRFIVNNPFMEDPVDPVRVFLDPNSMEPLPSTDIYRPLRTLLFQVEHRLGSGRAAVHHTAGLLLHLMNTILVLKLLLRLLSGSKRDGDGVIPALLGAGFFALHPIQVEAVAWISSRGDQLFLLFVLLALLNALAAKGRTLWLHAPVTAVLTLAACLSKESGMMTGALILLAWWCLPPYRNRTVLIHGAGALVAAALFLIIRSQVLGEVQSQTPPHGGNLWSNFFFALYGCAYQASLLVRPWFQNVDYQDGFFDGTPFVLVASAGLLYAGLLAGGVVLLRGKPLGRFALLFFAAAQLPTSSLVLTLRSLVNDRYLYLPMVAAAVFAGAGLASANSWKPSARRWALGTFAAALLLLGGLAFHRCGDWKAGDRLWASTLSTHPSSVRARTGLARIRFNQGEAGEAIRLVTEALSAAKPGTALRIDAYAIGALALNRMGREGEAAEMLRRALDETGMGEAAARFGAAFIEICHTLWYLEMKAGHYDGALAAAEALVSCQGEQGQHLLLLGLALRHTGDLERAKEVLLDGLARDNKNGDLHLALYEVYLLTGQPDKAKVHLDLSQELKQEPSGEKAP